MFKKISKKKKILLISLVFSVLIAISLIMLFILKDNEDTREVIATTMEKIQVLNSDDSSEAAELIKKNIVKITNELDEDTKIVGTGFFHESGYLITNSHIVDIKGNIKIEYYDGTSTEAKLISNDITSDIALLYVEDALSHEKFMETSSQKASSQIQDPVLSGYMEELETKHNELYNKFLNLL